MYSTRRISFSYIIEEVYEDYGIGEVHFEDSGTGEAHFDNSFNFQARQASFLEYFSSVEANEQVSLLSEFDDQYVAKPLLINCLHGESGFDEDGDGQEVIIAVQRFKKNLHEMTSKSSLFWKIDGNIVRVHENFRNFLMIMIELLYKLYERRVFVAQHDILKNIAFESEETLQNPLLIRLQRYVGDSEDVEGLRVLKKMLQVIIAKRVNPEYVDYELQHFMTLLEEDKYFHINKKEIIIGHPLFQTSLGKKKLLMEMWTKCRRRTLELSWFDARPNKITFVDWKSSLSSEPNIEGQSIYYEELETNIGGLVKYGKNLYARDWDYAMHWKRAGLNSDKDVTDFLTRLFPQLFTELHCYKHRDC